MSNEKDETESPPRSLLDDDDDDDDNDDVSGDEAELKAGNNNNANGAAASSQQLLPSLEAEGGSSTAPSLSSSEEEEERGEIILSKPATTLEEEEGGSVTASAAQQEPPPNNPLMSYFDTADEETGGASSLSGSSVDESNNASPSSTITTPSDEAVIASAAASSPPVGDGGEAENSNDNSPNYSHPAKIMNGEANNELLDQPSTTPPATTSGLSEVNGNEEDQSNNDNGEEEEVEKKMAILLARKEKVNNNNEDVGNKVIVAASPTSTTTNPTNNKKLQQSKQKKKKTPPPPPPSNNKNLTSSTTQNPNNKTKDTIPTTTTNNNSSNFSNNNNNNDNNNSTITTITSSPNSQVIEAERQAAIAAAISANSPTTMSPSVAAGIAKVLALPGLMSDKVGEMSDKVGEMSDRAAEMMIVGAGSSSSSAVSGGGGGGVGGGNNRHYPPPPPPRTSNSQQYSSAGPTIVALPPMPKQQQQQQQQGRQIGQIMRPVRFDDVKIAFAELVLKEESRRSSVKSSELALVKEDEVKTEEVKTEETPSTDKKIKDDDVQISAEGGESSAADKKTDENNEEGEDIVDKMPSPADESLIAGEEGGMVSTEDNASSATEISVETATLSTEKAPKNETNENMDVDSTTNDNRTPSDSNKTDEECNKEKVSPPPDSKTKEPTPPPTPPTAIPDSFLRFLLLVARVPIIIEEHYKPKQENKAVSSAGVKQKEAAGKAAVHKEHTNIPPAAKAAAKRAFDIFSMAQTTYETISERQQRTLQDGERVRDATSSFFAACAGETVVEEEAMEQETISGGGGGGGGGKKLDKPSAAVVPTVKPLIGAINNGRPPPTSSSRGQGNNTLPPSAASVTASSMASSASAVFSNVMSKMVIKKQGSFSDISKKFITGGGSSTGGGSTSSHGEQQQRTMSTTTGGGDGRRHSSSSSQHPINMMNMEDYEILIDQEMLGLTVENVLERTIIRTLLPDGAAQHAGAQVGSLIAKVGNVDTSNLTHFETIDELRQSQKRPLKLTLRHIGKDVLRRAREEMGRLIRGRGVLAATVSSSSFGNEVKPWRKENANTAGRQRQAGSGGETFDLVLNNRWPSKSYKTSSLGLGSGSSATTAAPPPSLAMTRAEMMHSAGKDLVRILALLVVGLEKELSGLNDVTSSSVGSNKPQQQHLSVKELSEAIEITSKILFDYARGHPDVNEKQSRLNSSSNTGGSKSQPSSSFYPVPPGRVQGKKHGAPPASAGRGGGGRGGKKSQSNTNSPLLRIGDALSRTRSFLVEYSSITATTLRWEIIDYLCSVLDLDTEQELSEKESASSTSGAGGDGGGEASSPTSDLGSAGSILKLIVLNCSTAEDDSSSTNNDDDDDDDIMAHSTDDDSDTRSAIKNPSSNAGNCFLSVVHRLAASKSTSARVTACSLGPVLWSHLDFPRQLQLRGVITRALHDVEVIVRKSTATVLHEIAELVFDRRAVPWLVLMCERSMTDPEPQLRAAAVTLTWHLAEHLPNAFLGDASKGSRSIRRLPPRNSPTFMDVYLLQCKLFPVANNLAEDRVASVRLSVAAQCDRLCNALGEHWFSVIIDLLQALLSDGDERVRSEAILCMPRLVESVIVGTSNSQNVTVLESLLPLALKIQKDASSSVRSSLATATGELLIFLVGLGGASNSEGPPMSPGRKLTEDTYKHHKKHVDDTLIPILQKLLQDSDPEVTTASLRAVTNASRSGARDTSSRIPSCSHVKVDTSIDDDLVSLSSHHSHQSHTSYERTKPVFIPVLSEEQVLRLLPTLSNLATSTQWRVRQSAVEIVPALMGCTHRHETRHEISKLCLRLMNDKVDAVRKTAAECLCLGGSSLARHGKEDGGEWIKNIVIPHLRTCSQSEDSKQRLLSLKMIEIIITNGLCPTPNRTSAVEVEASSPGAPGDNDDESIASSTVAETALRMILNIAASHISDRVANVRLNVGRTFGAVMLLLDRSDVDFAVATLEKQLDEETSRPGGGDRDVIYFAQQAISSVGPMRRMSSST